MNLFALVFVLGVLCLFLSLAVLTRASSSARAKAWGLRTFIIAFAICVVLAVINQTFYRGVPWDLWQHTSITAPGVQSGPSVPMRIGNTSWLIAVGLALVVVERALHFFLSRGESAAPRSGRYRHTLRWVDRTLAWLSAAISIAALVRIVALAV